MIVKVKVTQEHIDSGRRCFAAECPIALALMEAFKSGYASTSGSILYVHLNSKEAVEFDTPREVEQFIYTFDRGELPKPFEFEIDTELAR